MKKRFLYSLLFLLFFIWTSESVKADCSSSWYNAGDASSLDSCGADTGYRFLKYPVGISSGIATLMAIEGLLSMRRDNADAQAERVGQYLRHLLSMQILHQVPTGIGPRRLESHIVDHHVLMTQESGTWLLLRTVVPD